VIGSALNFSIVFLINRNLEVYVEMLIMLYLIENTVNLFFQKIYKAYLLNIFMKGNISHFKKGKFNK